MQNKALWGLVILNLLATAGMGAWVYSAQNKGANGASPTASASDDQIKTWVTSNPQIIMESVNSFLQGQQAQSDEVTLEKIKANHAFLYNDDRHPVLGNKDGDVTVVEFLDYNCGYCKKAYEPLMELVSKDANVRVVLIEIPILAESSNVAARWALAAHDQGGYATFHKKLMEHRGQIDEAVLAGFATEAGLNAEEIQKKADADDVKKAVAENLAKSQELGIQGTPGFIIGDQVIRGYIEYPAMKEAVDKARAANKG